MNNKRRSRNIKNYDHVLRISYRNSNLGNEGVQEDDLKINNIETLESAFNRFTKKKNIDTNREDIIFYYLEKDGKYIPLQYSQTIENLGIKSGDKVIISNEMMFNKKKKRNIAQTYKIKPQNQKPNKMYKKIIIILSILFAIIVLGAIFLCYLLFRKKRPNEENDYSMIIVCIKKKA